MEVQDSILFGMIEKSFVDEIAFELKFWKPAFFIKEIIITNKSMLSKVSTETIYTW